MKFLVILSVCAIVYAQQEINPQIATRDLPADVLRDFPGACFASTNGAVFQVGQVWPLKPFCGRAMCVRGQSGLIERVQDCGNKPKDSPGCKLLNGADEQKDFPTCCPKYVCQAGAQLIYPTEAEIKAIAQANQQKAVAALQKGQQGQQG